MSSPTSNNKSIKPSDKPQRDPSLTNRKAGQSRTILLYPLHNSIEEVDIEQFVKRAALSSPLRIELFKFHSSTDQDEDIDIVKEHNAFDTVHCNAYAYCTFTSSADCWLIRKHLNHKLLKDRKVSITFSVIPRTDLEGMTNIVEFGTNYPPITDKTQIVNFLNNYNNNDPLISNPSNIHPAPGHGGIKGKWFITYDTPETATKALEFYSGRYHFDTENNKNRFVIINYQLHRDQHAWDRKECFYGITDRVIIRNVHRYMDEDDILLFLQSNGFDAHKDVLDVYMIFQMRSMVETRFNKKKQNKNRQKFKPRNGYAIVTFSSNTLANKAYTNLNTKWMSEKCRITTGFTSPSMTDPLKKLLKGDTNVIHLNNLPWNVTQEQIKEWLSQAAKKHVGKKHLKQDKDDVKDKNDENPFYSTDIDAGTYCTQPIRVFIKYRDGYSTGRANATFAMNKEADIAVEMLNGKKLGGRKISINWALPIKDYRFKEQRDNVLHLTHKEKKKKKGKKRMGNKGKSQRKGEMNKNVNKGNKRNKADNEKREQDKNIKENEKRGKKRRQTFRKPFTKKIKLTL